MATGVTLRVDEKVTLYGISYVKFIHTTSEGHYILEGFLNGKPVKVKRVNIPVDLQHYKALVLNKRTWLTMKL